MTVIHRLVRRYLRESDARRIERLSLRINEAVWLALDAQDDFTGDDIGPIANEVVQCFRNACRAHLEAVVEDDNPTLVVDLPVADPTAAL